jgi:hypothetical protein
MLFRVLFALAVLCSPMLASPTCELPFTDIPVVLELDKQASFSVSHEIKQDRVFLKLSILASEASWFGVGFSESGHMLGADLLVVEMEDEETGSTLYVGVSVYPLGIM